jgi:hypothetical protein
MKDILIIGAGEIGTSLKQVEEEAGNKVYMRDLEPSSWETNGFDTYAICHVAIPYKTQDQFIGAVHKHMLSYKAKVTIIHSTVEIGTTRELIKQSGDEMIVHSFVRGVHPNLAEGIKTFQKCVGSINNMASAIASGHFCGLGLEYKLMTTPEASEMAKLLSTTYYAWNIFFAGMVNELCDEHGLYYDEVYKWANETYNEGYRKLGREDVVRPVLTPPEGKIGGHCLLPNIELLPEGQLKEYCKKISDTM